ncbi:MurR/RpiR family transcriptional regulator [Parasedimentitalea maritima]|uniref:SIS domain-containing protein n=1 Tax=Parasedimentitalea maritima TaxID=2578117 RepID=A0A6A4RIJ7_9RHOB|nr:MurR/RpiR family transcriptional regulator [Zongyanglinia marina]KAE9629241.1 SIS domain-containing protein [Zongyanglinia marina]
MDVKTRLENMSPEFTATERRLSALLLMDYPFAGLLPIQELASNTKTSPPTVSRFVSKLGFSGFQEFQRQLIEELKEGQRSPVDLQKTSAPVQGAFLAGFLDRAEDILETTKASVTEVQFEKVCGLLSDPKRSIYVIGGRMSDTIASYISRHLRQVRVKVFQLPPDPEVWPEYLLRMRPRDILLVVDFRRYQVSLAKLAKKAHRERHAQIVLMTDPWLSPVAKNASEVLTVPIDSGTLWDSYTGALALMEAIVTRVAENNWDQTKGRIEAWDASRIEFGETNEEN